MAWHPNFQQREERRLEFFSARVHSDFKDWTSTLKNRSAPQSLWRVYVYIVFLDEKPPTNPPTMETISFQDGYRALLKSTKYCGHRALVVRWKKALVSPAHRQILSTIVKQGWSTRYGTHLQ